MQTHPDGSEFDPQPGRPGDEQQRAAAERDRAQAEAEPPGTPLPPVCGDFSGWDRTGNTYYGA